MSTESMPNWLDKRAHLTPNRIAIINENGDEYSFSTIFEKSLDKASYFQAYGIKKGDHVALLISNSVNSVIAIHALQHIGAVMVFLNTRLSNQELIWQLKDSTSDYLIVDNLFQNKAEELYDSNDHLTLLSIEGTNTTKTNPNINQEFNLQDVHTIMYTSGTTGKPKGVQLTYGNHWWSAIGSSLNLGLQMEDRWLCCVPLFHVSGLSILMRCTFYGIPMVLYSSFQPENIAIGMQKFNVSIISVVTAQLQKLLSRESLLSSSLRCVLVGGGPVPHSILEACRKQEIPVFQTYGMTETASQLITLSPEDMFRKSGSAGKALFPSQVRIEKDGQEANPMEVGEIVVKGPTVTTGYYNRENATKEAIRDGWFYTGDLGFLDEEGFLFVVDRRNDLIISGGENIYPAEIESVLLSLPQIDDAGVTGKEDEQWGKVPIAFVVKKEAASVTVEELVSYCEQKLASYKVPKHIYFVDILPRNASNKLVRRKLLELIHED